MTISKKQFDFTIRGRIVAIDSTAALALANLQPVLDAFVLEGIEYDLTTPASVGVGNEAVSYPTLVADLVVPATTAAVGTLAGDVLTAVGTLKGIS